MRIESEQIKTKRQSDIQKSENAGKAETHSGDGLEIALSVDEIYMVFRKQKKTRKMVAPKI